MITKKNAWIMSMKKWQYLLDHHNEYSLDELYQAMTGKCGFCIASSQIGGRECSRCWVRYECNGIDDTTREHMLETIQKTINVLNEIKPRFVKGA